MTDVPVLVYPSIRIALDSQGRLDFRISYPLSVRTGEQALPVGVGDAAAAVLHLEADSAQAGPSFHDPGTKAHIARVGVRERVVQQVEQDLTQPLAVGWIWRGSSGSNSPR